MYLNALRTLFSLKKRDNYPMYSMTYYGDYGFDDFLTQGAKSDDDIRQFVRKRLTRRKEIELNTPDSGCTVFIANDINGGVLYARNYDFPYTPSLLLKTKPKKGFKSVSVVDMTTLGYGREKLPEGRLSEKLPLLASPYLPFDGMNEKGLAVAILQVAKTDLPNDPDKITLNTTTIIRLMLDKTSTVDEAIAVFYKYNIYFSNDIYCHYLIADRSGKSVIIEFWDGAMHIVEETIATNFIAYNQLNIRLNGESAMCERYGKIKSTLDTNGRVFSMTEAASLLCDVGGYDNDGTDRLQWSVVYNLKTLKGLIFPHRQMPKLHRFRL